MAASPRLSIVVALLSVACAPAPYDVGWGLPPAATAGQCAEARSDVDRDGIDDACEFALAAAFAPELVVDARDCSWQADLEAPRLGGGYLFVAQRTPDQGAIRIAYLPAYYRDCGWSGAACVFRGPDCSAHDGDSELIVVDVAPDATTGGWRTVGVFLSAHCSESPSGSCRWFRDDDLRAFAWVDDARGGAPRVWVSRGKHANYPSQRACDRGSWSRDTCDENRAAVRFPVLSVAQNLGSRNVPQAGADGCLVADVLPLGSIGATADAPECFWEASGPFWGWQTGRSGEPPTSYAYLLETIAGF